MKSKRPRPMTAQENCSTIMFTFVVGGGRMCYFWNWFSSLVELCPKLRKQRQPVFSPQLHSPGPLSALNATSPNFDPCQHAEHLSLLITSWLLRANLKALCLSLLSNLGVASFQSFYPRLVAANWPARVVASHQKKRIKLKLSAMCPFLSVPWPPAPRPARPHVQVFVISLSFWEDVRSRSPYTCNYSLQQRRSQHNNYDKKNNQQLQQ